MLFFFPKGVVNLEKFCSDFQEELKQMYLIECCNACGSLYKSFPGGIKASFLIHNSALSCTFMAFGTLILVEINFISANICIVMLN